MANDPKTDIGLSLALAAAAALSAAAYLWMNAFVTEGIALSLAGLAGLLGAGPLLFGWTRAAAARAGGAGGCASCGFTPGPGHPALAFCLMCGKYPKAAGAR